MRETIHVLIVEDSEDDALLIVRELRKHFDVSFKRVDTAESMTAALAAETWQLIISDYSMPAFKGTDALELLKETALDIPFIFVSGTIGEDTAVGAMKAGAQDYLVKGNLKRLIPAIQRELSDAETRRERRRAEAELEIRYKELETLNDRLRERTIDLERANTELKRLNRGKDEFLHVMSHELRTPLTAVIGYAGLLRERMLGDINHQQEQAIEKLLLRSKDLLNLINTILDATQIEAEEVVTHQDQVILPSLLDRLKTEQEEFSKAEVKMEWDCPPDVGGITTDGEKLKTILGHLIDNAVKFTEKGTVTIQVRDLRELRKIQFRVSDTGIGIAEDDLSAIFDRFRQVDGSETRLYGGVGLGLYVARKFSEALGGEIEVSSRVGNGSTFTLTVPY
jgi:signal transduction histidine kinase